MISMVKKLLEHFMKKTNQQELNQHFMKKTNQQELRIEKEIKEKGDKLYVKW